MELDLSIHQINNDLMVFGLKDCELTLSGYQDHLVCLSYSADESAYRGHLKVDDGVLLSLKNVRSTRHDISRRSLSTIKCLVSVRMWRHIANIDNFHIRRLIRIHFDCTEGIIFWLCTSRSRLE